MRVSISADADGVRRVLVDPGKKVREGASVSAVLTSDDGTQEVYFFDRSAVAGGAYLEDINSRLSRFVRRSGDFFVLFMPGEKRGKFHLEFYVKEPARSVVIYSADFVLLP